MAEAEAAPPAAGGEETEEYVPIKDRKHDNSTLPILMCFPSVLTGPRYRLLPLFPDIFFLLLLRETKRRHGRTTKAREHTHSLQLSDNRQEQAIPVVPRVSATPLISV